MKKYYLFIAFTCLLINAAEAQTLFTYGKNSVDAKEFLKAYAKNNTQPVTNKAKSISNYLDLYVNSRLKIQEAYQRHYDTLPQITSEVASLRSQIIENYLSDPSIMDKLEKEAFDRSQKDIRVSHIFISFKDKNGVTDSLAAQKKRNEILLRLKKGEDFSLVAKQFSDDPAVATNKGDVGYITVFTLPYEFENIIYKTPVGKYSLPVASKIGYHIFKNAGERKAVGKIKVQQIMLALPPGSDEGTKKALESRADSLYKRLLAGDDFSKLATQFSNDYISAATGGNVADISVGQYDPAFENVLWSLPKDGAISKPFLTSHGWHILKRVSVKPVSNDPSDKTTRQELEQKIKSDSRWKASDDFIFTQVKKKGLYRPLSYNETGLFMLADSVFNNQPVNETGRTIKTTSGIFIVGNETKTVADWLNYAATYRFRTDGSGIKPNQEIMDEFIKKEIKEYYAANLENFNPAFREQMTEFRDGNLFFEIMQQEIWNKAQNDSAAVAALYQHQQKKYTWNQSADAVIFYCADQIVAKMLYDGLKKNPESWNDIAAQYTEKVVTDSARYEWSQLPSAGKKVPVSGMITEPVINTTDNTATFAYIIKTYPQPTQRSFIEAKGLLINDYQEILEKKWNDELKKKYPVVINQKVLTDISK